MICYLIFSVLIAAAAFTVRRRSLLRLTGAAFYAVQAAFAVRIVAGGLYGETSAVWFAFDAAGTLFYCLLCIVSAFAFFHSKASLHDCDLRQTRTYAGLLMLLTTAIAGAYFASNLADTLEEVGSHHLETHNRKEHHNNTQPFGRNAYQFFVCRKNRDC